MTANYRLIYRVAVIAPIGSIAFMPIQAAFFIIWRLPTNVGAWFAVFAQNPIRGTISLDLLYMLQIIFVALICLALMVTMWVENKVVILLATAFGLLGLSMYFASNVSFEMLNAIVLLLFAYTMYGSAHFSRMNAHIGMLAGLQMTVPASFGIVGMSMAFLSLIPWGVFCFLCARVFIRMMGRV